VNRTIEAVMRTHITSDGSLSRRTLLRAAAAGGAGAALAPLSAAGLGRAPAPPAVANPDEALERLLAGNERFISGNMREERRDLARVRELAAGQSPFAAILGCADSRVPVEILFDEGFGDIFTVRVAGNVATPEEIASLEYAVAVLGTPLVLVLGHSDCGAVGAARERGDVPGQISALFQHILPSIADGATLPEAVASNVAYQVRALARSSTVISRALEAGTAAVRGGVYNLEDGRVRITV
jgi:carbonic anhydrase